MEMVLPPYRKFRHSKTIPITHYLSIYSPPILRRRPAQQLLTKRLCSEATRRKIKHKYRKTSGVNFAGQPELFITKIEILLAKTAVTIVDEVG